MRDGSEEVAMKKLASVSVFLLCVLPGLPSMAQRGHELQFQFGVQFNKGVSFYDYQESGAKRHNFEFDQKYISNFYSISWRFPVNSYLEAGMYFSHSLSASLLLLEAESIVFDSANPGTRPPSNFFLGETKLTAKSSEIGIDIRATMARFNKFKTYVILNAGIQRISITKNSIRVLEVQDEDLKNDLLNTYQVYENVHMIGIGVGISRLIAHGINIKILEVYVRNLSENKLLLSFPVSFEFRTGVSYQFYKRK